MSDLFFVAPVNISQFLACLDDLQLSRLRDEVIYLCCKREEKKNEG